MYLHGSYYNRNDERISVYIVTGGSRTEEVEIGGEDSKVFFSDDPVELTSQVNDTFDHLLTVQATVRLLAKEYMGALYNTSCRDTVVNIYRGDTCLFAGYLEPRTYSQGYNEDMDEVELTCIDCLSALQYSRYKDIGALGVNYAKVRKNAGQRTFLDIMEELITNVVSGVDILGGKEALPLYYDGSKSVDSARGSKYSVFSDISIPELLFLGDTEDDVWTQEEVLTEMLRYLNLHILQDGLCFYIFSWETMRAGNTWISWTNILDPILDTRTSHPVTHDITTSIVADCDTQITVGESYNQLLLTDSLTEVESVVESPLDEDSLLYAFDGMQKFMTELSSKGEGKTAFAAFANLVHGTATTYESASITDWFVQLRKCTNWTFHYDGSKDVAEYWEDEENQHQLLVDMGKKFGMTAVMSLGKVQKDNGGNDNSPISSVEMTDYLVISVNGNGEDDEKKCYPSPDNIKAAIPCAVYNGNTAGGNFSPADKDTTNYIVISGNLVLNPLMPMTDYYNSLQTADDSKWVTLTGGKDTYWHKTVADKNNVRYYTRKRWKAESWRDEPAIDTQPDSDKNPGFIPYTGEGPQQYSFDYSAVGDSTDQLSKVPVLACMLIIGDKCVVEKKPGEDLGTDVKGTGNGQLSDYVWMDYKTREECASDDEYYQQSFTIGFDPKIGDKLIGSEFKMQNNLSYTDGVDEEGTAIPITKKDKVSGVVQFMILGPVNSVWDNITRRHPSFWRHTSWTSTSVPLLAHTSSILVKELEVKVTSDNGKVGSGSDDKDIVYMSDTKETYVNKKDDLEFKITTALTTDERKQLGVKNSVSLSTPTVVETDEGLLSVYDWNTGEKAKPEQLYVDAYWREWHEPRVVMEQNLMDTDSTVSFFDLYRHPAIGKTFHVQGIDRNLTDGTAKLTMKEITMDN